MCKLAEKADQAYSYIGINIIERMFSRETGRWNEEHLTTVNIVDWLSVNPETRTTAWSINT